MLNKNLKKKLILSEAESLINSGTWYFVSALLRDESVCLKNKKSILINKFFIKYSQFFENNFKNKVRFPVKGVLLTDFYNINLKNVIYYYKNIFFYFVSTAPFIKFSDIFFQLYNIFLSSLDFIYIYNEIKN